MTFKNKLLLGRFIKLYTGYCKLNDKIPTYIIDKNNRQLIDIEYSSK